MYSNNANRAGNVNNANHANSVNRATTVQQKLQKHRILKRTGLDPTISRRESQDHTHDEI
jgi:hypothetical protein